MFFKLLWAAFAPDGVDGGPATLGTGTGDASTGAPSEAPPTPPPADASIGVTGESTESESAAASGSPDPTIDFDSLTDEQAVALAEKAGIKWFGERIGQVSRKYKAELEELQTKATTQTAPTNPSHVPGVPDELQGIATDFDPSDNTVLVDGDWMPLAQAKRIARLEKQLNEVSSFVSTSKQSQEQAEVQRVIGEYTTTRNDTVASALKTALPDVEETTRNALTEFVSTMTHQELYPILEQGQIPDAKTILVAANQVIKSSPVLKALLDAEQKAVNATAGDKAPVPATGSTALPGQKKWSELTEEQQRAVQQAALQRELERQAG